MDNIRQENKNSNLRITGVSESEPSTKAVCELMTAMDISVEESEIDTYRLVTGNQK